jgi:uncharacterized repeat protein (TIGR03803 family)
MTYSGGTFDKGVLFEWDPSAKIYIKKLDFNGVENGSYPNGSLIMASNGILCGTTMYGGVYDDCGVLFTWNTETETYTKKLDFNREENTAFPDGSLLQADNGKFYGVSNCGHIFEWDTITNTCTRKYNLDADGTRSGGANPNGPLVQANNGMLYGTALNGGLGSCCQEGYGVLFEWDIASDTYTKKMNFNMAENGRKPVDCLIQADNGKLYGMTHFGGEYDFGVLFEWDPVTNTYSKKLDFNGDENGKHPLGSLLKADNGILYGMTHKGGKYDYGVLFEWDPYNNTYVKKFDFDYTENGGLPYSHLMQAENGKLYGTTGYGGLNNWGVIFEWDPVLDIFTRKIDFNGSESGGCPYGSLVQADNGKLYGMTYRGGTFDKGVLFEWDPSTNIYAKKLDFNGAENGSNPFCTLILATNGNLYGLTELGGVNDLGVLFEWDPAADTYSKKIDFNGAEYGLYPRGSLMQAGNGKLYGMTSLETVNDIGSIFEWDPATGIFTRKLGYNSELNISYAQNSLMRTDDEKMYRKIDRKEVNGYSFLLKRNSDIDTYIKGNILSGIEGMYSQSSLVEIIYSALGTLNAEACDSFTSPSGNYIWSIPGIYKDTIPSAAGYDSIITVTLTLKNSTTSTIISSACDSFASPSGKIWTESGEYKDTIPNTAGCDSVITVNLIIDKSTTDTISQNACDSYASPSGKIWTESGEYKDTIPNTASCDSVITVNLTITSADTSITQNLGFLTANAAGATYQWIDCDDGNLSIEGETRQTFSPAITGRYAVIISQNNCIDTSACFSVVKTGLMVNTFKQNITLYPNPNDGSFSIDLGKVYPKVEISISELDGRIFLKDEVFNNRIIDMQISALLGTYLVIISSDNERAMFKVMKK